VLNTTPTGTTACNIDGMKIHSAFKIKKKNLEGKPLKDLVQILSNLQVLIIDEISMVGQWLRYGTITRLQVIKQNYIDAIPLTMICLGDFLQLKPMAFRKN
jgi:hypothetical protein